MRAFLVAGNDTGVGKTHVVRVLARVFSNAGQAVQVVKPVETGVEPEQAGDAQYSAAGLAHVSAHRLLSFRAPMAPLAAAALEGKSLGLGPVLEAVKGLPECSGVRLIEGAGGLAVPIDKDGSDWATLGAKLGVDAAILVVEDRLGAINQARLLAAYARGQGLKAVFWLNEVRPQEARIRQSNLEGLAQAGLAIMGRTRCGSESAELLNLSVLG